MYHLHIEYVSLTGYMKDKGIATTTAKIEEILNEKGYVYFNTSEGIVRTFNIHKKDGPIALDLTIW